MAVFLSQSTWGYYTQPPLVPLSFTVLAEFDTKPLHLKIQSVEIRKITEIYVRLWQYFKLISKNFKQYCYWKSLHCNWHQILHWKITISSQKAKLKLLFRNHVNGSTSKTAPYVSFFCYHFAQGVRSRVSFLWFLYRGRISPACDKTRLGAKIGVSAAALWSKSTICRIFCSLGLTSWSWWSIIGTDKQTKREK